MATGTRILLLALLLSACMPVPVGFPAARRARLGPVAARQRAPAEPGPLHLHPNGPMEVKRVKLIGPSASDTATLRVEVISRRTACVDVARRRISSGRPRRGWRPQDSARFHRDRPDSLGPRPGRALQSGNLIFGRRSGALGDRPRSQPAGGPTSAQAIPAVDSPPDQPVALELVARRGPSAPWPRREDSCLSIADQGKVAECDDGRRARSLAPARLSQSLQARSGRGRLQIGRRSSRSQPECATSWASRRAQAGAGGAGGTSDVELGVVADVQHFSRGAAPLKALAGSEGDARVGLGGAVLTMRRGWRAVPRGPMRSGQRCRLPKRRDRQPMRRGAAARRGCRG